MQWYFHFASIWPVRYVCRIKTLKGRSFGEQTGMMHYVSALLDISSASFFPGAGIVPLERGKKRAVLCVLQCSVCNSVDCFRLLYSAAFKSLGLVYVRDIWFKTLFPVFEYLPLFLNSRLVWFWCFSAFHFRPLVSWLFQKCSQSF